MYFFDEQWLISSQLNADSLVLAMKCVQCIFTYMPLTPCHRSTIEAFPKAGQRVGTIFLSLTKYKPLGAPGSSKNSQLPDQRPQGIHFKSLAGFLGLVYSGPAAQPLAG